MARGWESKSVESQMEDVEERRKALAGKVEVSAAQAIKQREREGLESSRKRVLLDLEKATRPGYREQLESALQFLEKKLAALD